MADRYVLADSDTRRLYPAFVQSNRPDDVDDPLDDYSIVTLADLAATSIVGGSGAVDSVNGDVGTVVLTGADLALTGYDGLTTGTVTTTDTINQAFSKLSDQIADLAAIVATKVEGLNGVANLWGGDDTEYAAIGAPDADTVYAVVPTVPSGISLLQFKEAGNALTTGSTQTVTMDGALTPGSTLLCVAFYNRDTGTMSTPTGGGFTYTTAMTDTGTGSGTLRRVAAWTAPNAGSSTPTITFNGSTANYSYYCVVLEFAGVNATPLDTTATTATVGLSAVDPATVTCPAITTVTDGAAVVSLVLITNASSSHPGTHAALSGATLVCEEASGTVIMSGAVAYRVRSLAGAETPSFTFDRNSGVATNSSVQASIALRPA
jgi:hypothetical protein